MDATNYRPISITSALLKKFEHILHQKTTNRVQKSELKDPLQFGFQKRTSTACGFLCFIESVWKSIDSDKIVHAALFGSL